MIARLRYTASAKADFRTIAAYLRSRSGDRRVAARFLRELDEKCREVAASPFSIVGRARTDLRPDLRSVAYKGYVIFFRQLGDVIEVVNVIEGHRDMDRLWREDG